MKRWASILLVLILAVVCLTGCGKDDSDTKSSRKKETAQSTQKTEPAKDEQKAEPAQSEQKTEALPSGTTAKGDIITFGRYEQDNNLDNGPEPIEWIVLNVQGGKALLISKYGLDAKPFNIKGNGTWKESSLRSWLNNEFLNGGSFNDAERTKISLTDVYSGYDQNYRLEDDPYYFDPEDYKTQDYVFLLSYREAITYFPNSGARQCVVTDYAINNGADVYHKAESKVVGMWWLRTEGSMSCAEYVMENGERSDIVENSNGTLIVRPAVWVNLQ